VAIAEAMKHDLWGCGNAAAGDLWDASLRESRGPAAGVHVVPKHAQDPAAGVVIGVRSEASLGTAIVEGRARCLGQEPKMAF